MVPGRRRRGAPDRLAQVNRILIDGRNVQHALERGTAPGSLPTNALISQVRGAFPGVEVELVLDGHPSGGPSGRVSPHLVVTFSRGRSADAVIGDRVSDTLAALGAGETFAILVVSDDRDVRDQARGRGAQVESTAWLGSRLERRSSRPGRSIGSRC
jgi:YacP-like NYN domain